MNLDRTLISILGGLGGMFGWGTSDFLANLASEKVGHHRAFFWSQIAGLALMLGLVVIFQPSFTLAPNLFVLSLFAGAVYALGYLLFYKGFELGNVSVISAVINVQIPIIVAISYFWRGQPLSNWQLPAICLLLIGVTLVSVNFKELRHGTVALLAGVKETVLAALLFGIFYWPINEYVVEQADWLSVSALIKLAAIVTVLGLSYLGKKSLKISNASKKLVLLVSAVGLLEALGVLSVTFGQSYGDGIIVAPIASSLVVVTVALAMIFSKEKLNRIQGVGIALVVAGIILTAV